MLKKIIVFFIAFGINILCIAGANPLFKNVKKEKINNQLIQYSIKDENLTAFLFIKKCNSIAVGFKKDTFTTAYNGVGESFSPDLFHVLDKNNEYATILQNTLDKYFQKDLEKGNLNFDE